jgi:hypothetical protein
MNRTHALAGLAVIWTTACTTLGPMPATIGVAAVPTGRPGIELQGGVAPGYYLSDATQAPDHRGQGSGHLLALIEPDHWLGTRGLIVGARTSGRHGEDTAEPFLGYRGRLADGFSLAAIGHGTVVRGADRGASYRAGRIGGELALDARLVAPLRWLELHGQAAVAAMYVDARGTYCADSAGLGVDCNQDSSDRMINGTVRGVFPGRRPAWRSTSGGSAPACSTAAGSRWSGPRGGCRWFATAARPRTRRITRSGSR